MNESQKTNTSVFKYKEEAMRDPKRIRKICDRLAAVWEHVPDWRLGQLMLNLLNEYVSKTGRDPFFPEDEELMTFFESVFPGNPSGGKD